MEWFLKDWVSGTKKVFKWCREFLPPEYIVINKFLHDEFVVVEGTFDHKDITFDLMVSLLKNQTLSYKMDHSPYMDLVRLKTGGCTCGSWAIASDYPHMYYCSLYGRIVI